MFVYFELHIDDANGHWVDNIKETQQCVNSSDGFDINYVNGNASDDYGIVIDMNIDIYKVDGIIKPIITEFKEKYLLELREKKIKRIMEKC